MSNIQVTHDTDPNNARSRVERRRSTRTIRRAWSQRRRSSTTSTRTTSRWRPHTRPTAATRGTTPRRCACWRAFTVMTDPTMAWDDSGNVFLVGLVGKNPPTWTTIGDRDLQVDRRRQDLERAELDPHEHWRRQAVGGGRHEPGEPVSRQRVRGVGRRRSGIAFARSDDHGATWIGAGTARRRRPRPSPSGWSLPEINVAADGAVYIVSIAGSDIHMLVSTDGGDSFQPTAPSGDRDHVAGHRCLTQGDTRSCPGGTSASSPTRPRAPSARRSWWRGPTSARASRASTTRARPTAATPGRPARPASRCSPARSRPNFQHFHPQIVARRERRHRLRVLRVRTEAHRRS